MAKAREPEPDRETPRGRRGKPVSGSPREETCREVALSTRSAILGVQRPHHAGSVNGVLTQLRMTDTQGLATQCGIA